MLLLALGTYARGAWYDQDVDRELAKGRITAAHAVTGWVMAQPHEYYEQRIRRLTAKEPKSVADIDDLAVALDRLGRTREAITIIQLDRDRRGDPTSLYRFHANLGAFEYNQWRVARSLAAGVGHLKRSLSHLETCLNIEGITVAARERTQYWIVRQFLDEMEDPELRTTLGERLTQETDRRTWGRGLPELIALDGYADSPDILAALAYLMAFHGEGRAEAGFAICRYNEIVGRGMAPRMNLSRLDAERSMVFAEETVGGTRVKELFSAWSREANVAQTKHEHKVRASMKAGLHPDEFLDYWEQNPGPELPVIPAYLTRPSLENDPHIALVVQVAAAFMGFLFLRWAYRFSQRVMVQT